MTELHGAVKRGDLAAMKALLERERALANARSETDERGTFPLLDLENDAIALGWAAFFGRPEVVRVLIVAGSQPSQRNRHGLTPLACALGGTQGRWKQFSNASLEDWRKSAEIIRAHGGVE